MRNVFISKLTHEVYFLLESLLVEPKRTQQVVPELHGIGDDVFPVRFPLFFYKQLAPFQHALINKIAIYGLPKLSGVILRRVEEVAMFLAPPDSIVSEIP